jgi:hypothetical protein
MPSKELTTVASETLEDGAIQVEVTLPVRPRRQENRKGGQPDSVSDAGSRSRIPRITRLMALAIKFQDMVDRGEVRDYADLARLGYVTRARITQIMNLLNLAPDIQEELLTASHLGVQTSFSERSLRRVMGVVTWGHQRKLWKALHSRNLQPELDPPGSKS